ncbi:S16 family serine protease [Streptomyces winkii]|uniref:S16 family serine protease n=1 Tax=Streptomyces winkii TaxID=3051178 RepID=UPI0028D5A63F|nr:S16 family serine protease [Streptomyces sp. DSM 40971]
MRRLPPRRRTLVLCALPLVALFAVTALAPLPFALAQPGLTANVIGDSKNKPVITVTGEKGQVRKDDGKLLLTTIAATPPGASVHLPTVVESWFRTDRAAMPTEAVYPVGETIGEVEAHNKAEMRQSQNAAIKAALRQLHKSPRNVRVSLRLADVGGPSAGLFFSLGIVDKIDGDGRGGGLTGGRIVAGTGTIKADGTVGPVGGVPLKTKAAKRDGASVFLVPRAECADAKAEQPKGLRLVPVDTLGGAVKSLTALKNGGRVPAC